MLSNMGHAGVERSVNEFYHGWFADGTVWDRVGESRGPAPGFVVGGPNPSWSPDASYNGPVISPPAGQPIQKSYKDWNASYPENSWEVTENGIYYQSAYVQLASNFARYASYADWLADEQSQGTNADGDTMQDLVEYILGTNPTQHEASPLSIQLNDDGYSFLFPFHERADVRLIVEDTSDLHAGNWSILAEKISTAPWISEDGVSLILNESRLQVKSETQANKSFVRLRVELLE